MEGLTLQGMRFGSLLLKTIPMTVNCCSISYERAEWIAM